MDLAKIKDAADLIHKIMILKKEIKYWESAQPSVLVHAGSIGPLISPQTLIQVRALVLADMRVQLERAQETFNQL